VGHLAVCYNLPRGQGTWSSEEGTCELNLILLCLCGGIGTWDGLDSPGKKEEFTASSLRFSTSLLSILRASYVWVRLFSSCKCCMFVDACVLSVVQFSMVPCVDCSGDQ
jgi:hypothetical protein